MSARPVSVASDGDCMANTKETLDYQKRKPCCCVPGCGKTSNVVVFADYTISEAANVIV